MKPMNSAFKKLDKVATLLRLSVESDSAGGQREQFVPIAKRWCNYTRVSEERAYNDYQIDEASVVKIVLRNEQWSNIHAVEINGDAFTVHTSYYDPRDLYQTIIAYQRHGKNQANYKR